MFTTTVDWYESHKLLKVEFPLNVKSSRVLYEIQGGFVERPTHRNTPYDAAMFEVCGQRYADISESDYGVSLLNNSKYGYSGRDSTLCLSLLRAPKSPDANCDMGVHAFKYLLLPHIGGNLLTGKVVEAATALNDPIVILSNSNHSNKIKNSDFNFLDSISNSTRISSQDINLLSDTNPSTTSVSTHKNENVGAVGNSIITIRDDMFFPFPGNFSISNPNSTTPVYYDEKYRESLNFKELRSSNSTNIGGGIYRNYGLFSLDENTRAGLIIDAMKLPEEEVVNYFDDENVNINNDYINNDDINNEDVLKIPSNQINIHGRKINDDFDHDSDSVVGNKRQLSPSISNEKAKRKLLGNRNGDNTSTIKAPLESVEVVDDESFDIIIRFVETSGTRGRTSVRLNLNNNMNILMPNQDPSQDNITTTGMSNTCSDEIIKNKKNKSVDVLKVPPKDSGGLSNMHDIIQQQQQWQSQSKLVITKVVQCDMMEYILRPTQISVNSENSNVKLDSTHITADSSIKNNKSSSSSSSSIGREGLRYSELPINSDYIFDAKVQLSTNENLSSSSHHFHDSSSSKKRRKSNTDELSPEYSTTEFPQKNCTFELSFQPFKIITVRVTLKRITY